MVARLFVDKIEKFEIGGFTTNLQKIRHNLSAANLTTDIIFAQTPNNGSIPTVMFHLGRFVAIFQSNRDLTNAKLAFINFEIDLDAHFDHFADFFTPKIVGGFHKTQQIISLKSQDELDLFVLSDDPLIFQKSQEN